MKRFLLPPLLILIMALGSIVGKIYMSQDAQVFPRRVNAVEAPNPALSPFDKILLPTPDGEVLSGILFPAEKPSPTLVIAFAGNAHNIVGFTTFLKNDVLKSANAAVTGFSYRGYPNTLGGGSTGTPTQANTYADAELIYDTFTRRLKPGRVYVVGYSLGTAVAAHLASVRRVDGIILVAPPASIRRLGQEKYPYLPVGLLAKHPFATEDIIGSVATSVTIIHTPTDGLIPAGHAGILHAAQPAAQMIEIEGADHGSILNHPSMPQLLRGLMKQPLQP